MLLKQIMPRYIGIAMTARVLNKNINKILVIGPIYDNISKIQHISNINHNYDIVIFNGSLCYPNNDLEQVRKRISIMNNLLSSNKYIYNVSDYDLLLAYDLNNDNKSIDITNWIWSNPNIVIVDFEQTQSTIIITSGGISPKMNRESIMNNLEVSFINDINCHKHYGGMQGYFISNNPLTNDAPKFYNFSAQIGNHYGNDVYAQEVDGFGLKRTILL